MKHISILIPTGGVLGGIEIARNMIAEANNYVISKGNEAVFQMQLVGAKKNIELNERQVLIRPDVTINYLKQTDLIIIPAINVDLELNNNPNVPLINWVRQMRKQGAEVACLCVGAFLLAKTGILDGKTCTTHWKASELFINQYPEIKLLKEKIITDEDGIYSSAGGFSMLNLIVYLIEKYAGREVALYCAKFFQVDIDRNAQLPFIIFQGQKEHNDIQVKQAQTYIEEHYQQRITIDQLAEMLAMGRRSLERRFKKATSNTLNEYIQRVKIEAAKKQLESGEKKINDIMLEVGYSDQNSFRHSFKLFTGLLPNEYRSKYHSRITN
ncbi:GlxA family transcriptional regulator [Pedobacter heparinus]|uniref:Helix-turn-helix-domain containing protein AraC type n=1 Tax=Pedobacter heparinus (strain ATCC 13125 / DSM 2366 / CIP 104194 / JCM 7457 / NBRC 12017 / NCIMB 9290 / NRRL B-14731 / HIM 762-3) TaxID=485917 RepID=C6XVC1_PEDHD|nr:helix-turn-helix domain-containing protein [Pedobacter heparinus]ACU03987.1 helix-turn-helix- domain containing protein AraC type [Pedobacter heparinus DSM 2366]